MNFKIKLLCPECRGELGILPITKIPREAIDFDCKKCGKLVTTSWGEDLIGSLVDVAVGQIIEKAEKGVF